MDHVPEEIGMVRLGGAAAVHIAADHLAVAVIIVVADVAPRAASRVPLTRIEAAGAVVENVLDARYADGSTLRRVLNQLRMVKTDTERALMQRAIDITVAAHREAMKSIEPGMYEYEAEALIAARDRTGVKILESFMVWTHRQWVRAREVVRSGRLDQDAKG